MLSLHQYNNRLMQNAGSNYLYFDYNVFNQSRVSNIGGLRYKHIDHAMLPYLMNDIEVIQQSYMYDHTYTEPEYLPSIIDNINGNAMSDDKALRILRVITTSEDMNTLSGALDQDLWTELPDAIKTLYNTCVSQVELREDYTYTLEIRVFKSKFNHTILMLVNFSDYGQASEMFLTIGALPLIFEDYKAMMCEEELNYCSALVKRSQIKRISNVNATNYFNALTHCPKYVELLRTESTKYVIQNIVRTRLDVCQRDTARVSNDAEQYLRHYENALKEYYRLNKELQRLQEGKDDMLEEVKAAISIPAVYKVDTGRYDQYSIELTIKTPCSFYELDEVECVMNNVNEDTLFYKFLTDVFINQKYKLYFGHTFQYSFSTSANFNANNIIDTDTLIQMDCMFNPHLYRFSCFGDYKPKIIQAMQQQDLTMFINWCIASLKSINFRDGAVINSWKGTFNDIEEDWNNGSGYGRSLANIKCLQDEDGNFHSLAELYLTPDETTDDPELDLEEL
jgi:hypothetical protein